MNSNHDVGTMLFHEKYDTVIGVDVASDKSALVATQRSERFGRFYESLVNRGKPKKVALVAVMRKMLVTLNTMMKHRELWRDAMPQS